MLVKKVKLVIYKWNFTLFRHKVAQKVFRVNFPSDSHQQLLCLELFFTQIWVRIHSERGLCHFVIPTNFLRAYSAYTPRLHISIFRTIYENSFESLVEVRAHTCPYFIIRYLRYGRKCLPNKFYMIIYFMRMGSRSLILNFWKIP